MTPSLFQKRPSYFELINEETPEIKYPDRTYLKLQNSIAYQNLANSTLEQLREHDYNIHDQTVREQRQEQTAQTTNLPVSEIRNLEARLQAQHHEEQQRLSIRNQEEHAENVELI